MRNVSKVISKTTNLTLIKESLEIDPENLAELEKKLGHISMTLNDNVQTDVLLIDGSLKN